MAFTRNESHYVHILGEATPSKSCAGLYLIFIWRYKFGYESSNTVYFVIS